MNSMMMPKGGSMNGGFWENLLPGMNTASSVPGPFGGRRNNNATRKNNSRKNGGRRNNMANKTKNNHKNGGRRNNMANNSKKMNNKTKNNSKKNGGRRNNNAKNNSKKNNRVNKKKNNLFGF